MTRPVMPDVGAPDWGPANTAAIFDVSDRLDQEIVDRESSTGTGGTTGPITVADLPAGSLIVVTKTGTTWPSRPTTRTDVKVAWLGADPAPTIVASGIGGAINNVDVRWRTP
jgi:hypothetical protein